MSSTNIYTEHTTPYFYIIRHIDSGKLYAGSKWAIGCHPNTFMVPGGYTTSSTIINSILKSQGLNAFEILRIDTNCDGLHVYEYETGFLTCNNCAQSDNWFNVHNNTGMAFGLPGFEEKSKTSKLKKYGVEHAMHSKIIREKTKQTNIKKYGVEYTCLSPVVQEKSKQTFNLKYGVNNPFQAAEIKEQIKQSNIEKYGVEHTSQVPEFKEKQKQTNMERYGVTSTLANLEIRNKGKQTLLEIYGVDNISKVQVTCPHCFKIGGKNGMTSKHFDNCTKNPNYIKPTFVCPNCSRIFTAKNTFSGHKKACDKKFNKIIS